MSFQPITFYYKKFVILIIKKSITISLQMLILWLPVDCIIKDSLRLCGTIVSKTLMHFVILTKDSLNNSTDKSPLCGPKDQK